MLIASIDVAELSPFRIHGWLGKRLTASYGCRYDFDDASFVPAEPIPDWLLWLRAKAARFACLRASELVQVLLIRYDPECEPLNAISDNIALLIIRAFDLARASVNLVAFATARLSNAFSFVEAKLTIPLYRCAAVEFPIYA